MTTKIYFDAEFTGLHKKTTLISLGMVSDCGKTFYAEFADYTKSQVDTWLEKNVMNNLRFRDRPNFQINAGNDFMIKHHTVKITELLEKWLAQFRSIEMWGDTLAYDWVLFCDLFGSGMALPRNISYIPLDIATVFYQKGKLILNFLCS